MSALAPTRWRRQVDRHLEPGEVVLHVGHGIEPPWWSGFLRLGSLLWRHYLLVATDRRLLLVEQRVRGGEKRCTALAWTEIARAELGRGLLARPLRLEAPARGLRHRILVPRLSPLAGNLAAVEGVVATWAAQHAAPPRAAAL